MALKTDHPKLGDYVRTTTTRFKGRVTGIHYACKQDDEWLGVQALSDEEKASYPWIDILVDGGGSVHVPACIVEKIEPFDFTNNWADWFFAA